MSPGTQLYGSPHGLARPGCTLINRPIVHTIYPPVAEAYFFAVHLLSPAGWRTTPIQAAAASCALALTAVLLLGLGRVGVDRRLAVLWAWCPTVALEAGNNAHVDVLAAFLTAAALLVLARPGRMRRSLAGGTLLALAIWTKVTPVLVVPAVARRRWYALAAAGLFATVAVYLPHVLAVGSRVIGFLPGYLQQEGYSNGTRFLLLGMLVHGKLGLLAASARARGDRPAGAWRTDPDRPWRGALVMTAAALAVTTPPFPWYTMLLVMLVAFDGRAEWLASRWSSTSRSGTAARGAGAGRGHRTGRLCRRAGRGRAGQPAPLAARPGSWPRARPVAVPVTQPVPASQPVPAAQPVPPPSRSLPPSRSGRPAGTAVRRAGPRRPDPAGTSWLWGTPARLRSALWRVTEKLRTGCRTMVGSDPNLVAIVVPIVALISLAFWLGLCFCAGSHPYWRHHQEAAGRNWPVRVRPARCRRRARLAYRVRWAMRRVRSA